MTETEARAALAAFDGLERWIAEQRPREAVPAGWTMPGVRLARHQQAPSGGRR